MKRLANRLEMIAQGLLQPINTTAIVLLGAFTVVWGLWVINPFWNVFDSAKLYSALLHFAPACFPPEVFWGTIAIVCGLITIRGALKPSYPSLKLGSVVACWYWLMIAIFFFIGDWHNTGGISALCFAVYAAFIYLNVKVNHYYRRGAKSPLILLILRHKT